MTAPVRKELNPRAIGRIRAAREPHRQCGAQSKPFDTSHLGHCTGTLISPTVVVSAAHCFDPATWAPDVPAQYVVAFHPTLRRLPSGNYLIEDYIAGTPHLDRRWLQPQKSGSGTAQFKAQTDYDLAVLVLDRPASELYPDITPAPLPALGTLDAFATGTRQRYFTQVGYGLQREYDPPVAGGDFIDFTRNFAISPLHKLTELRLETSGNPMDARDTGGSCSGDSGGPAFLGDTIVGVHSYGAINGNSACSVGSTNGAVRLDTTSARSFLGQFVALP